MCTVQYGHGVHPCTLTLVTVGPIPANSAGALPSDKVTGSTVLTETRLLAIITKEPSTATYVRTYESRTQQTCTLCAHTLGGQLEREVCHLLSSHLFPVYPRLQ